MFTIHFLPTIQTQTSAFQYRHPWNVSGNHIPLMCSVAKTQHGFKTTVPPKGHTMALLPPLLLGQCVCSPEYYYTVSASAWCFTDTALLGPYSRSEGYTKIILELARGHEALLAEAGSHKMCAARSPAPHPPSLLLSQLLVTLQRHTLTQS